MFLRSGGYVVQRFAYNRTGRQPNRLPNGQMESGRVAYLVNGQTEREREKEGERESIQYQEDISCEGLEVYFFLLILFCFTCIKMSNVY